MKIIHRTPEDAALLRVAKEIGLDVPAPKKGTEFASPACPVCERIDCIGHANMRASVNHGSGAPADTRRAMPSFDSRHYPPHAAPWGRQASEPRFRRDDLGRLYRIDKLGRRHAVGPVARIRSSHFDGANNG